MRSLLLCLAVLLTTSLLPGQELEQVWEQNFLGQGKPRALALRIDRCAIGVVGSIISSKNRKERNAFLYVLDDDNTLIVKRIYQLEGNQELFSAVALKAGEFLLVGYTELNGKKDGLIIQTDQKGDIIKKEILGEEQADETLQKIIRTKSDNFIVAGITQKWGRNQLIAYKLSSKFEIKVTQDYSNNEYEDVKGIYEKENEEILIVGNVSISQSKEMRKPYMIVLTKDLAYRHTSQNSPRQVINRSTMQNNQHGVTF